MHFGTVTRSEAGLSDLWNKVVSWFTGEKKLDAEAEAQVKVALENVNESQNQVIQSVNEVIALQNQLEDLSNGEDKAALDAKMGQMQEAVQKNNELFSQLMQIQQQLQTAEMGEQYASNFEMFVQKQQEIESYYPKIEDRYNELVAFSTAAEEQSSEDAAAQAQQEQTPAVVANVWSNPTAQQAIESWLRENGRDKWGGVLVEGMDITTPQRARGKDRFQYLYETYPEIRAAVDQLGIGATAAPSADVEAAADAVVTNSQQNDEAVIVESLDDTAAPAAATNSNIARTSNSSWTSIAPKNYYDNASVRARRDEVYKQMNDLVAEGKMQTTEYKELYREYTTLSDQLRKTW
jgi:hypothetical protein